MTLKTNMTRSAILLLGAVSVFAFVSSVQSQVVVGTQDFSITVEDVNAPEPFSFPPVLASAGAQVVSGPVVLSGFTGTLPIEVSGQGDPEYSLDGVVFTSLPGVVANGAEVYLRLTAGLTENAVRTGTVTVEGVSADLVVTTQDLTPEPFSFPALAAAAPNVVSSSASQVISGVTGDVPVSISEEIYQAEYRIGQDISGNITWGDWVGNETVGSVRNNEVVQVRIASSPLFEEERVATLTVGNAAVPFSVTTRAAGACDLPNLTVGTDCGDGRVYAGEVSGREVFLETASSTTTYQHKTTQTFTIGNFNPDGFYNMAAVMQQGLAAHPAFNVCASNTTGGHDWYLPSIEEIQAVRNNLGSQASTYLPVNLAYLWTSSRQYDANASIGALLYLPRTSGGDTVLVQTTDSYRVKCITYGEPRVYVDPCAGSPTRGDLCENGSVYAGVKDGKKLFAAATNQSGTFSFSSGTPQLISTSLSDGMFNKALFAQRPETYPGAEACAAIGPEWYLPSIEEARVVFSSTNFGVRQTFPSSNYYLTSSESSATNVNFIVGMTGSETPNGLKSGAVELRCISNSDPVSDPDPFTFSPVASADWDSIVISSPVEISGVTGPVYAYVTGGGSPLLSVNGVDYSPVVRVLAGESLRVRVTTPNTGMATVTAQVQIGGVESLFSVTTGNFGPCESPDRVVGQDCFDGRIYAGVVNGQDIFIASSAEPSTYQFKTSSTYTVGSVSADGFYNMYAVQQNNLSAHPAFNVCASKTTGGYDWYLPSQAEFSGVTTNLGAQAATYIDMRTLTASRKWVSNKPLTDSTGDRANYYVPGNNTVTNVVQTNSYGVQCITYGEPRTYIDPCAGSPTFGELCADEAIYAGTFAGKKLFVPQTDLAGTFTWEGSPAGVVNASASDGTFNKALLSISGTFPAADACAALGEKWYLPSVNEAIFLSSSNFAIRPTVDGNRWWTSSDDLSLGTRAHYVVNSSGSSSVVARTNTYKVRCIYNDDPTISPDPFAFEQVAGADWDANITSEPVTISGLEGPTYVTISGEGDPMISVNGGGFTRLALVSSGDTLRARLQTPISGLTTRSATVRILDEEAVFAVTTGNIGPCEQSGKLVGQNCGDGRVYAGVSGGRDIFLATSAEAGTLSWKGSTAFTAGAYSVDGFYNRHAIVQNGASHPASNACAVKTTGGQSWYLPSVEEITDARRNLGALAGDFMSLSGSSSERRWTSTMGDTRTAGDYAIYYLPTSSGETTAAVGLTTSYKVQCISYGQARVYVDPCSGNPNIGEICEDGAIYAGVMSGTGRKLFVSSTVESGTRQFKTTTTLTGGTTTNDGQFNTNLLIASGASHPAASLCRAKGDKWYLPSQDEIFLAGTSNRVRPAYASANRWSSTEVAATTARANNFVGGGGSNTSKTSLLGVVCAYNDLGVADTTPDAFSFNALTGVAPGVQVSSAPVTISGINSTTLVEISGEGNGDFSINGGVFSSASRTIQENDQIVIRMNSSSEFEQIRTATLTIGGVSGSFSVTTMAEPADSEPDPFSLEDITSSAPSQIYTSDPIPLTGFDLARLTPVNMFLSVNGSAFSTTTQTVAPGDVITARIIASAYDGETRAGRLEFRTYGSEVLTLTVPWSVTTVDPTFAGFSGGFDWNFSGQPTGIVVSELSEKSSTAILIPAGRSTYTVTRPYAHNATEKMLLGDPSNPRACRIRSGTTTCVRIPDGSTTMTVQPGDQLFVTIKPYGVSSNATIPTTRTTWCVDSYCMDFNHTDSNRQPDQRNPSPFTIPSVTGATAGSVVESDPVRLTWNGNTPYSKPSRIPIRISGTSAEYRIDGGAWTTTPTVISSGQEVEVRLTAAAGSGATRTGTLTFGTYSQTFSVTTQ
jgi:hypothetical protein